MKSSLVNVPRIFQVGDIVIKDYGTLSIEPWEMISVTPRGGGKCDITATEWGMYIGSSLNARMREEGFKIALVRNPSGKLFLNAVIESKQSVFEKYLNAQSSEIIMWLDEYGVNGMDVDSVGKKSGE